VNQKFAEGIGQVWDRLNGPVSWILVAVFGASLASVLVLTWLMVLGRVGFDGQTFVGLLAFGTTATAAYLLINRTK